MMGDVVGCFHKLGADKILCLNCGKGSGKTSMTLIQHLYAGMKIVAAKHFGQIKYIGSYWASLVYVKLTQQREVKTSYEITSGNDKRSFSKRTNSTVGG